MSAEEGFFRFSLQKILLPFLVNSLLIGVHGVGLLTQTLVDDVLQRTHCRTCRQCTNVGRNPGCACASRSWDCAAPVHPVARSLLSRCRVRRRSAATHAASRRDRAGPPSTCSLDCCPQWTTVPGIWPVTRDVHFRHLTGVATLIPQCLGEKVVDSVREAEREEVVPVREATMHRVPWQQPHRDQALRHASQDPWRRGARARGTLRRPLALRRPVALRRPLAQNIYLLFFARTRSAAASVDGRAPWGGHRLTRALVPPCV